MYPTKFRRSPFLVRQLHEIKLVVSQVWLGPGIRSMDCIIFDNKLIDPRLGVYIEKALEIPECTGCGWDEAIYLCDSSMKPYLILLGLDEIRYQINRLYTIW